MAEQMKFTNVTLNTLPVPDSGERKSYSDEKVPGLLLRVTHTGIKTFLVYRKVKSKPVRVTIGRYPEVRIDQARRLAKRHLADMAEGTNPNTKKKAARAKTKSLGEAFADYLVARSDLKRGTIADYHRIMKKAFSDWQSKPLADITKDMVATRHRKLGARSKARANNAMRVLRAVFNFAIAQYEDENGHSLIPINPVQRLSKTKSWYKVNERKTVIKPHELEAWFIAVLALKDEYPGQQAETVRDYLILLLLTGLRREEAASLTWGDIDFVSRTLTVMDTKNGEAHTIPLSDYLLEILIIRKSQVGGSFVFPSASSASGHLINGFKQQDRVRRASGVDFTLHDLRRTFITIAESLDISAYAVKRLANHKMKGDVTAGYITISVERLRKPVQAITNYVLKAAGIKQTGTMIDLRARIG
jgi:integrase